jgi:hypothetical protein
MFFKRNEDTKSNSPNITEANRVLVLTWLPKINGVPTTASAVLDAVKKAREEGRHANVNIGHVAAATPNRYASLWPAESAGGNKFKVINAQFHTLQMDITSEDGPPDTIVSLYSLDTAAIESAFDEIQSADDGFVLAGDKSLVRLQNERKGRNCNGLVYELMQRGNVDKVLPFTDKSLQQSAFAFYISPDKFNAYIKLVKDHEVAMYPQTNDFTKIQGEYQAVAIKSSFSSIPS